MKLDVTYTLCASNHSVLVTDETAMLYTQQSCTSSSVLWLYLGGQSALGLRTAFEQLSIFFVGKLDADVCNFLQVVYDAQVSFVCDHAHVVWSCEQWSTLCST